MGSGYASMIGSIISAKRAGHWGIRPLGDGEHLLGGDTAAPCRAIRVTDPEHLEGILTEMSGRFVLLWSPVVEDAGDSVILGSDAIRPQVVAVLEPRRRNTVLTKHTARITGRSSFLHSALSPQHSY